VCPVDPDEPVVPDDPVVLDVHNLLGSSQTKCTAPDVPEDPVVPRAKKSFKINGFIFGGY